MSRGARARFYGRFVRARDNLFDRGVLDEIGLAKLFSITGRFYFALTRCFQQVSEPQSDDELAADTTVGGIPGLFTISEGIVMRGREGQLSVAYVDAKDDVVRYFTTERQYSRTLPKIIDKWRERFKEKTIVYDAPPAGTSETQ
jgi:hypothetical protein